MKQSDQYIGYVTQGGLGLPDRDYYFRDDEKFKEIREKYLTYITELLSMGEIEKAAEKAAKILEIETNLAKEHWTRVQNRDRNKTYNKYDIKKLNALTPAFNWSDYIREANISNVKDMIVRQPGYFKHMNKVYKKYSVQDWKDYLTYKLLTGSAELLSKDFVELDFDFYSRTLSGIQENQPRWKRAVESTNAVLGEVVGKVYVKKHFKPEAKKRMIQLVENLRNSYLQTHRSIGLDESGNKDRSTKKIG